MGRRSSREVRSRVPLPPACSLARRRRRRVGRGCHHSLPIVAPTCNSALQRLELLHSIDVTLFTLFILSYLLSPSHLLTLLLRLTSQIQFGSPRLVHPTRSLRFFLIPWSFINCSAGVVHALEGSSGTKGRGWAQRGLVLDFVGQAHTPSTLHLLLLDALIAALQLILIILAFGEPVSPSVAGSALALTAPELTHNYSGLLGREWSRSMQEGEEEEAEEADETEPPAPRHRRKSSTSSNSNPLIDPPSAEPIIDIRLDALWREVRGVRRRRGTAEEEEEGLLGMEEGRAVG